MANDNVLSPYNKLPELMSATILLVGVAGIGKRKLAKALIDIDTTFSVHIRVSDSLPLPIDLEDKRPKIDYIVFMIDLTNRESMKLVESAVTKIHVEYHMGRCCFVVLRANDTINRSIEVESISEFADAYDTMVLFGNLNNENESKCLANKIMKMTEIVAGFKPYLTSLLVGSTRQPFITETAELT